MAGINFFLKDKNNDESIVIAIIRNRGLRYKISTGEKVLTEYWNQKKHRCNITLKGKKYQDGMLVNERLDSWEVLLNAVIHDFSRDLLIPDQNTFKAAVNKELEERAKQAGFIKSKPGAIYFTDYINDYIKKVSRSANTKKGYKTTHNQLIDFENQTNKRLRFDDIDIEFYWTFKKWMEEKNRGTNYVGSMIKNIKVFMNQAKDQGLHNSTGYLHKEFKTESEEVDTIFLTEEEILKIHRLKFTEDMILEAFPNIVNVKGNLERKLQAYEDHRDAFLIGYCTALRHSDYSRLIDLNLANDIISIWTRKMDKKVFIPAHWMLKEILTKRSNKLPEGISDQKHNLRIKEIGMLAGIDQEVLITQTEGNTRVNKTYKKYELITTHTARRSGATNMYLAGIDLKFIQDLLGHAKIETTLKYIKVNKEENAKRLQQHPFFLQKK